MNRRGFFKLAVKGAAAVLAMKVTSFGAPEEWRLVDSIPNTYPMHATFSAHRAGKREFMMRRAIEACLSGEHQKIALVGPSKTIFISSVATGDAESPIWKRSNFEHDEWGDKPKGGQGE